MLTLHQIIFNKKAPRFPQEATTDLLFVKKYFIEEWFTYIRVFGSTTDPHVLPLYVSGKLLAREIAYQTMGKGLTKVLKYCKKSLWPIFSVKCGSFALSNFVHATKESIHMAALRLHTLPKRQFDDNYFEDLLQSVVPFK